jgi:hypothetical protein
MKNTPKNTLSDSLPHGYAAIVLTRFIERYGEEDRTVSESLIYKVARNTKQNQRVLDILLELAEETIKNQRALDQRLQNLHS